MTDVMVDYKKREADGDLWLDVYVNQQLFSTLGPFATVSEYNLAHADLLSMARSYGAIDVPLRVN
jgi:hypothetical protein